ncbi:hypothetical protein [uncultured Fusobacterium sp.]|uniref:hypothetical protein n=1 Tax=uncultured Fusobacterium sp. TaxID=159267 RepID=UPI0025E68CEA|nr:hypothetical protein [uncultured Fusobacterium sp.]MCF2640538.1 hypothetical protein [Fusobacterium varium]
MKLIILTLLVIFTIYSFLRFFNTKNLYEIMVFGIDKNKNPTGKYYNLKFKKFLFSLPNNLKNIVYYSERFYNVNNLEENEQIELSFSFYVKNIIFHRLFNNNFNESIGFIDFKNYIKQKFSNCEVDFEKENFDKKVFHLMFEIDKQYFVNHGRKEVNINSFFNLNKLSYHYDENNKFTPLLSYITKNDFGKEDTIIINFEHFISDYEIIKIYKYKSKNNKVEVDISEFQNFLYSLFRECNQH